MSQLLLEVALAPALVAASTVVSRRFGEQLGGLVSALPAIAGPVLLLDAERHGAAFAAHAAGATLAGLVGLAGFAAAYALTATRAGWRASMLAGWSAAACLGAAASATAAHPLLAFGCACLALWLALAALPATAGAPSPNPRAASLPLRMAGTALLVLTLVEAANALGPIAGGVLAGLPALASALAGFTHAEQGPSAAVALLRGMLKGMAGFAVFCLLVGVLIASAGIALAFAIASAGALLTQAAAAALLDTQRLAPDPG